ncbi:MAG: hypothetical protein GF309_05380 [Candidatus Lokiarchaeota archaeon]|nr:hypothetical protein [Candidatus Lokiarchaeota archaeon]
MKHIRKRIKFICLFVVSTMMLVVITSLVQCEPVQMARNNHQSECVISDVPEAPTPLSPTNGSYTENKRPEFEWSESAGASSYTLQLDLNTSFSSSNLTEIDDLESTSYIPTTDLAHGRWYWRVRAQNASGPGLFSEVMTFSIIPSRTVPSPNGLADFIIPLVSAVCITGIVTVIYRKYQGHLGEQQDSGSRRILSPIQAGIVLFLVGLLVPDSLRIMIYTEPSTSELAMRLYSGTVFWSLRVTQESLQLQPIRSEGIAFSVFTVIFQLIFVLQVIEYCRGHTTKLKTFAAWLLSQLPVFVSALPAFLGDIRISLRSISYTGPTFATLVAGYIMMRVVGPNTTDEPWLKN